MSKKVNLEKIGFLFSLVSVFILLCQSRTLQAQNKYSGPVIRLTAEDGSVKELLAGLDNDGDGIDNSLELNGFTFNIIDGLQPWDGDTTVIYFKTDPLRWSTDGDPYSDYMEVTGINMPSAIAAPENHPLVAARPIIVIKMDNYDVIPIVEITDTEGGSQENSFTNETSTSNTVSAEVTVEASLNPFELVGGSVTAGYSHTWSSTQSSTSTFGTNWSNTRSTNPSQAARLRLRIYMENMGGATALDVQPTINLKLGKKTIATFIPSQMANILTPPGTSNSRFPQNDNIIVEKDAADNDLIITLDDLKAIQAGTPLSLEVVQVSAKVVRWNPVDQDWNSDVDWAGFESDIDPVSVEVRAELGDGENYRYQVFAGSQYWNPEFTLKDIVSLIFDVEKTEGVDYIEGREYPAKWYLSSPSQEIINAWYNLGQPQNMFTVPVKKNTKLVLMSPGSQPNAIVNLASYTADYKKIIVSAVPNNFPILSVKAEVPVNGEIQTFNLKQNNTSFFVNDTLIDGVPDGPGTVHVTNARGDVTTVTVQLPSFYSSAADVKKYSSFVPVPGGEYWIFPDADASPILVYCLFYDPESEEELTTAREYLTLRTDVQWNNYGTQVDGNGYGYGYFSKIRINPKTLKLALRDQTFREVGITEGEIAASGYIPGSIYLDYPAGSMIGTATASLDLSGTPYSFDPSVFSPYRYNTNLVISMDRRRQKFYIEIADPNGYWSGKCCKYEGIGSDSLQLVYNYDVPQKLPVMTDNNALKFNINSTDGYLSAGESDTLRLSYDFTLEAWIYPMGIGDSSYGGIIINKEGEYEIARWNDGTIRWALAISNPAWVWCNTFFYAAEKNWTHIALVYSSGMVKTYINGVLYSAISASGTVGDVNTSMNEVRIGNRQAGGHQFQGLIEDVRIWDNARSEAQIRYAFESKLSDNYYMMADSGLIAYWPFDEVAETNDGKLVVEDMTIYGNNAWLFGDVEGSEILTGLEIIPARKTPQSYSLDQNYPNPFNPETTIKYGLKKAADVRLEIYNITGKKVKTLVSDFESAGNRTIRWNGRNELEQQVASGTYICVMFINGSLVQSRKMLLIR